MSDWLDENGEPLGHWEPISGREYARVVDEVLGKQGTVFASRTEVGESLGDGKWRDRTIYTAWGRKGDDVPMVACDDRWDYFGERTHQDYRFVTAGA